MMVVLNVLLGFAAAVLLIGMWYFIAGLICGLILGAMIGLFVFAMCWAAGEAARHEERLRAAQKEGTL